MSDTNFSALHFDHKIGLFGDYEEKEDLLKISEIKNLSIFQIAKFRKSEAQSNQIKMENSPSMDILQMFTSVKRPAFKFSTIKFWMDHHLVLKVISSKSSFISLLIPNSYIPCIHFHVHLVLSWHTSQDSILLAVGSQWLPNFGLTTKNKMLGASGS